jgi:hypothetical protein
MSTFACGQCGAGLAFEGVRTARCPYCDSPNFVERPPAQGQPDPEFVVTFVGDAELARKNLDRWLGSRTMFADSALKHAKVEDLKGIYVPSFLYSCVASSDYTAEIGENYTETQTYTTTVNGKTVTRTRTVTKTEWRSLAGRHASYVTDVLVSASAGLANIELAHVEPYDFRQMRRFAPALISGWIAEEFARPAEECAKVCRAEATDVIGDKLRKFMPGDKFRDLSWQSTISWQSIDPILVPAWVFAVRYRPEKPPLRVVINGQTGKISGKVPLATWKILLAIGLVLAAIAAIILIGAKS